jgi:hypothetical protein
VAPIRPGRKAVSKTPTDGLGDGCRELIDLDQVGDEDNQKIAVTRNPTPRKCPGFKVPIERLFAQLGKDVQIRFD